MAVTYDPSNINALVDWTDTINEIDNQFGFIRSTSGLFDIKSTSQRTILFDKVTTNIRLMSEGSEYSKAHGFGHDNERDTIAMLLKFYKDADYIDVADIQGQRQAGSPDAMETLNSVRATKLLNLKAGHDQLDEYLRFKALKGDLPTGAAASGDTMYDVMGLDIADYSVAMGLEDATTEVDTVINKIKRKIATGVKSGSSIGGVDIYMDYDLWDIMMANSKFREVYLMYAGTGKQMLRDDTTQYFNWGVTDFFEHRGVRFLAYNPTFTLADGTTSTVLTSGAGFAIPRSGRDLYRGYQGPANKIPFANAQGQELYAFERMAPDQESYTLEVQSSKLYFATKPQSIIQLS